MTKWRWLEHTHGLHIVSTVKLYFSHTDTSPWAATFTWNSHLGAFLIPPTRPPYPLQMAQNAKWAGKFCQMNIWQSVKYHLVTDLLASIFAQSKKKITIIGFLLFFPCFHCCSHSFDFNGKCLVFYIYIYLHAPKLQFRVIRFMGMFMRLVASLIFFELLHGGRILISRWWQTNGKEHRARFLTPSTSKCSRVPFLKDKCIPTTMGCVAWLGFCQKCPVSTKLHIY